MPLALTSEEMDLLLALAQPIDQRQRDQFLHEVAAELEAGGQAGAVGIVRCTGWRARFRGAFSTRRSCPTRARWRAPKGRSSKLEHAGRGRYLSLVERPGFIAWASVGHNLSPPKARRAWPGCSRVLALSRPPCVASALTRSQIHARSRPHPLGLSRADALDRVRALRAARPLQRREAHGTVGRFSAATPSSGGTTKSITAG